MKLKNFDEALKERLNPGEIKSLKEQAKMEREALISLRQDVASAIAKHMDDNDMGFNEFTRRLGVSPTQAAKIKRGEANLTVASIAHIAAFLGKKPHLIFS